MANQWLTGAGTPSLGVGQVTDYYRDTVNNLVYYRENAFTWVNVPAFTPNPDGIGTTWLHGNVPPLTGQGSDGDYYYDEVQLIVYRKDGATWVPKGSLDFIGLYGVQWGNGLGAPTNTAPLNNLPAGSFYLDVITSDIYFKPPSMTWELKGQLGGGGGGGGGSSINLITTLEEVAELDVTSAVTPSVIYDLDILKADLASPIFTGTPTAPTPQTAPSLDNSTKLATTEFVNTVANAAITTAITTANNYADGLVVNLWDDRGTFNPSSGAWPTNANGGSGVSGAIQAGDVWTSSGAGTLTGGITVEIGDVIRALVDLAGNTSTDWAVTQNNIGYTAENSTNKATDLSSPDDTKYPTTKAIVDNVLDILLTDYTVAPVNSAVSTTDSSLTAFGKLQKQITDAVANAVAQATLRYVEVPKSGGTPSIADTDVTPTGSKLVVLTHTSAIACALDTPNNLGKSIGDSVNIIQGGVNTVTVTADSLVGAKTTSTTAVFTREGETKTFIATSATTWRVIGG